MPSSTAATTASAACGWTCQNASAGRSHSRPAACSWAVPLPSAGCRTPSNSSAACTSPAASRTISTSAVGVHSRSSTGRSAPGAAIGQSPTGSTSWLRCARRPGRPSSVTAIRIRVRQSRGPPGSSSTVTSRSIPARRESCSATTDRLEVALQGRLGVLPVAAAAAAGSRPRAGRLDALRRRDEHRDRVGAAERAAGVLGDRRPHPLAGQRVAHEDHAALVARDAVAPVRDRPDVELEQLVGPVG